MEFKVRFLVDSQDPEYAYAALRDALQYASNAHDTEIRLGDSWLKNNEPLPADCAQKIALAWQRSNKRRLSDRVIFQTHDPVVMAELNQTDLFIEGHVGFVPVTGEGQ